MPNERPYNTYGRHSWGGVLTDRFSPLQWRGMFALVLAVIFAVMALSSMQWARWVDRAIFDWTPVDATSERTHVEIVLVRIDPSTIDPGATRPGERVLLAKGIDRIRSGNPRVIGMSLMLMDRLDPVGISEMERLAALFRETLLETSGETGSIYYRELIRSRTKIDADRLLVGAVRQAGNVVMPIAIDRSREGNMESPPFPDAIRKHVLPEPEAFPASSAPIDRQGTLRLPFPELLDVAASLGFVHIHADPDGTIRRFSLLYGLERVWLPAYPLALAAAYLQLPVQAVTFEKGNELFLGDLRIPVSRDGSVLVRIKPKADAFSIVSFEDLIGDRLSAGMFENRMVLLGLTPSRSLTSPEASFEMSMDVPAVMARAASALLSGDVFREPSWVRALEASIVLVVGLLGIGFRRFQGLTVCSICLMAAGLLVLISMLMLRLRHEWIAVGLPVMQVLVYGIGVAASAPFLTKSMPTRNVGQPHENNRMLGVIYQKKGQLDKAFEIYRRISVDEHLKELLYNLALDYEQNHQPHKAAAVLDFIADYDPGFRDIASRRRHLFHVGETVVIDEGLKVVETPNLSERIQERQYPSTIGRYEIIREIGKGAMGIVYLGMDPRIRRLTSIKTFRFPENADPKMIERHKTLFFQEAESAGALSHPNIVTVYDAGEDGDLAYIAMEYLDGTSLQPFTRTENLLPIATIVGYAADVADALAYAHQKRVIHQDIKPANIMLLKTGEIKVTDFGIAQMMAASQHSSRMIMGTPSYMSPEQFSGKTVDGRSDIFSLGVTLFHLLTGMLPFTGSSLQELLRRVVQEPHPDPKRVRPQIPNPLVQVLNKALEKDAARRYADAAQMAEHLRRLSELMKGASLFQR